MSFSNCGEFDMRCWLYTEHRLSQFTCTSPFIMLWYLDFHSLVVPSEVDDKVDSCCPIGLRHRNYYSEADDDIFV